MDLKLRKDVVLVATDELIPYENNAKLHPPSQVEEICAQILSVGWDQPIVIDKDKVIAKGHGRRLAAIKLGLKHVPCIISDAPADALRTARLADNKVSEGLWDDEKLKRELEAIGDIGAEHLALTGFTVDDLKALDLKHNWNPAPDDDEDDDVNNTEENLDGIIATIKVRCPQESLLEVKTAVINAVNGLSIPDIDVV